MYKLFEIVYNSGGWGGFYQTYCVARNIEEAKQKSKKYQNFLAFQEKAGGDLMIFEISANDYCRQVEGAEDFNFTLSIEPKEKEVKE